MKCSIKLVTSERETKNGFPIYINLQHLKRRKKKCIGWSDQNNWNFDTK